MAGAYQVDLGGTAATYYATDYTLCETGSFSVPCLLKSLEIKFYNTGTFNGRLVVYSNAGTLLGSSAVQSLAVASTSTYYDISLSSPLLLSASTTYKIGYWSGTGAQPGMSNTATATAINSTPAFNVWTPSSSLSMSAANGQVNPTSATSYRNAFKMDLDVAAPNAPTALTVTNSPVSRISGDPTATWTYSDSYGLTQTKYQFRWRKVG